MLSPSRSSSTTACALALSTAAAMARLVRDLLDVADADDLVCDQLELDEVLFMGRVLLQDIRCIMKGS